MAKQYEGVDFPHPIDADQFTTAQYCAVRRNYSAMVENIDRWVGLFQEELRRRGELEKTLLVYSSDHGEMLGDHDAWGKSLPFQASIGVPLIFCGPGVHRGYAHDGPATILDLTATFLDYAGVPIPDDMDSRSMLPLLARETSQLREAVICGLADWRLAFEGRYKLVQYKGQEPVLRDIGNDPAERRDIAKAQIAQPVAEYLRDFLPEF
jgi:arylsulfatase A-like enzyme